MKLFLFSVQRTRQCPGQAQKAAATFCATFSSRRLINPGSLPKFSKFSYIGEYPQWTTIFQHRSAIHLLPDMPAFPGAAMPEPGSFPKQHYPAWKNAKTIPAVTQVGVL
jgi:hypothetical protein